MKKVTVSLSLVVLLVTAGFAQYCKPCCDWLNGNATVSSKDRRLLSPSKNNAALMSCVCCQGYILNMEIGKQKSSWYKEKYNSAKACCEKQKKRNNDYSLIKSLCEIKAFNRDKSNIDLFCI